jgi:hypothetical protein
LDVCTAYSSAGVTTHMLQYSQVAPGHSDTARAIAYTKEVATPWIADSAMVTGHTCALGPGRLAWNRACVDRFGGEAAHQEMNITGVACQRLAGWWAGLLTRGLREHERRQGRTQPRWRCPRTSTLALRNTIVSRDTRVFFAVNATGNADIGPQMSTVGFFPRRRFSASKMVLGAPNTEFAGPVPTMRRGAARPDSSRSSAVAHRHVDEGSFQPAAPSVPLPLVRARTFAKASTGTKSAGCPPRPLPEAGVCSPRRRLQAYTTKVRFVNTVVLGHRPPL